MRYLVLLAVLATPALADETCVYVGAREGLHAVETDAGYDVVASGPMTLDGKKLVAGDLVTRCSDEPGPVTRFSHCDSGWSGPVFFAGARLGDDTPGEIMVFMNEVWFRQCGLAK
ncbi:MAG: hypothetical protein JWM16_6359 [Verrucomicrobiales bacterium]|nr:hypothetical protein [Verrucomicrobiales bacterium]